MIHSYSCKNFYSINGKVEVRFDVNEKAPKSNAYKDDNEDRLSIVEAIVGPNASGKTNTVKALAFLRYLIAETADTDDDDDIPLLTFKDNTSPTEVEATFSVGERLFCYSFKLTSERILEEELKERTMSAQRKTFKVLLSRKWIDGEYKIVSNIFSLPKPFKPRRNSSLVSQIWRAYADEESGAIVRYWRDCVIHNVWMLGNRDDNTHHHDGNRQTRNAIKSLHARPELLEPARNILRKLDVGFFDFKEVQSAVGDGKEYQIEHKYEEKVFTLPLPYESSGTKRSILMLWHILRALNTDGAIAALDEFDAYLHPDIVETLVKLFLSPITNPKGSQLIFSSHNHQLLAELDKQQITLVEKSNNGATDVWRLDEVTGVRADDNYYNKYIAGAYGAKPKIEL